MNAFTTLLKREFWEHKGGMFWAPLVAGALFVVFTLMGWGVAEVLHDGAPIRINNVLLEEASRSMSESERSQFGSAIDVGMYLSTAWVWMIFAFVVFFYCLGALYDERRDRSVLFWKSLPVSDARTVLSKATTALLVMPVITALFAMATAIGVLLVLSLALTVHGGNPFTMIWAPANPFEVAASLIGWIPVYALWALPTVGWLLLCSSWARSVPFLWALALPIGSGILVYWFGLMNLFDLSAAWYWKNIVGRLLLSAVPGSDLMYRDDLSMLREISGPEKLVELFSLQTAYGSLAMPGLWIGALAGAAMIVVAIRLRRWRDEG